ncbi:MAG: hypothetical protein AAF624_05975 [Bacteroidota bacterium]
MSQRKWDWRPKLRWFAAEIVVVVAGVLIAFAVNAWWADRTERVRVTAALENVAAEIASNVDELREVVAHTEGTVETLDRFLARTPDDLRLLSRDSLVEVRIALVRPWTYDPGGGALSALLGSSDFAALDNIPLREALIEWQRIPDEIAEDYADLSALAQMLRGPIAEHGLDLAFQVTQGDSTDVAPGVGVAFAAFRADTRASDYAAQMYYARRGYGRELAAFIPVGDSLVQAITTARPAR